MAFSQDQLTALESAISQGVLTVKYVDKTVTYRSLSEMLQLREIMRKELGLSKTQTTRVKMEFSRGLEDTDES